MLIGLHRYTVLRKTYSNRGSSMVKRLTNWLNFCRMQRKMKSVCKQLLCTEKVDWLARHLLGSACFWYSSVRDKICDKTASNTVFIKDTGTTACSEKLEIRQTLIDVSLVHHGIITKVNHLRQELFESELVTTKLSHHFDKDIHPIIIRDINTLQDLLVMITRWKRLDGK